MIYDTYGQCITIVVGNPKGGVGKSTVSNTLASGFAMKGYRVLLIDTDTQGQAALALGLPKANDFYSLLTGKADPLTAPVVVDPSRYAPRGWEGVGELLLVRGDTDTQYLPFEITDALALRNAIALLADAYRVDFCIVDTSPTATLLDAAIYYAADLALLPTQPSAFSADGVAEAGKLIRRATAARVADGLAPITVLGVLVNQLQGRPNVQRDYVQLFRNMQSRLPGPLYEACLPYRAIWQDASKYGQSIFSYAPTGDTESAAKVVDETHRKVEAWLAATS